VHRNAWLIAGAAVALGAVTAASGLFLYLQYLEKQARIRIVRSGTGSGALMAVDSRGLRQLNELYSLPRTCSEANFLAASDLDTKFRLCYPVLPPITFQMVKKGVVLIPEGTRAVYLGSRFILPGGRLVNPYAANTYDMARDGAVEVERIRITQPPNENLEGWVQTGFLGRVCCGL
jgi:hypothetical protein